MRAATPAPIRFEGFADASGRFFRALAKHQDRDWFQAHRDEYTAGWLQPMQLLLREARDRLDPLFPQHALAAPKVFRINRDVRFGKDKSPYKTHIGGILAIDGASGGPAVPAPLYVHVGATETFVAAGHYMMLPPQLAQYRAALLDDDTGEPVARMVAKLTRAGFRVGAYDTLKKVPRGVDPAHPRAALLKQKGLIVSFPELPRELLVSRRLLDWIMRHVKQTVPLVQWLADLGE